MIEIYPHEEFERDLDKAIKVLKMKEENPKGWQHDDNGKRIFIEVRNEHHIPLAVEIVRVTSTGNYFFYIRPTNERDVEDDRIVPAHWFEVVEIHESRA